MDSLKRALNRIFKRGKKKNKQDQDEERQDRAAWTSSTSKAPQLPPITNASLLQGSGDERDKPLPSPRPLSMGKQSIPQEVVPESDGSQTAPPIATAVAEDSSAKPSQSKPLDPAAKKRSQKDDAPVTLQAHDALASATTKEDDAAEDDTVASKDLDQPLGLPAKSDSGLSGEQTASELRKENHAPAVKTAEEKVAVASEEPPTIKSARAAPGMSATSGPLEDYPEGG